MGYGFLSSPTPISHISVLYGNKTPHKTALLFSYLHIEVMITTLLPPKAVFLPLWGASNLV